jgi:hypothetical protein
VKRGLFREVARPPQHDPGRRHDRHDGYRDHQPTRCHPGTARAIVSLCWRGVMIPRGYTLWAEKPHGRSPDQ